MKRKLFGSKATAMSGKACNGLKSVVSFGGSDEGLRPFEFGGAKRLSETPDTCDFRFRVQSPSLGAEVGFRL